MASKQIGAFVKGENNLIDWCNILFSVAQIFQYLICHVGVVEGAGGPGGGVVDDGPRLSVNHSWASLLLKVTSVKR